VYRKWTEVLSSIRNSDNLRYSYEPTGSGDGKAQIIAGTVHFAGSDSALSAKERLAIPNAWFVPSLAGGIAVGFNVPGVNLEGLRIPREALADVFLGKIRQWSELAPWNPKLADVTQNISLVVRSESSGTTSVFTSALSSFSAEWKASVGSASLPKWPVAVSKFEGNAGVAIGIRLRPHSIGYLNVADATAFGVLCANISNAEGRFISPTLAAVQAATDALGPKMEALVKNGSTYFYVDAVDPPGIPEAYPISALTYFVFDVDRLDCEVLSHVLFFIYWAWTDQNAAAIAIEQSLYPIPDGIRSACLSALAKLKCEGKSPMQAVQTAFGLVCAPGAQGHLSSLLRA
jgi:phosphate transport system substrate-binding protein